MSRSAYELGWRVFRDRFDTDVPPDRRRRAVRVGILVGVATLVVLVVVGLSVGWPDLAGPAGWIGAVLLAVGIGGFAVACVPLVPRPPDAAKLFWSGSVMQAPERTERYFGRGPAPTIAPADRDEVLRDAELVQSGQVPDTFRGFVVTVAGLLAAVSLLFTDTHVRLFSFVPVFLIVRLVLGLVRLGRVERARVLAAALPEVPPAPSPGSTAGSRRTHRPAPRGSKLGLPDD
ncbi:hypothetical protein QUG92_13675 [Curtobacterium sp. RHCKG23]|uniref:Uncharacterized protein n=1 Tax=Curtobacterium citri TaxID=3055139 RepID=A0ABT7T9C8_9MICO|nr:hypothetical protein [Curtobacterium citri]MDM7886158.1 hypothetical protein [Curtobacterium citri]